MKGETYAEFVKKFEKVYAKTTDDCYTPEDVWKIVEDYCCKTYDIDRSDILRPFYPGGNYKEEDYTDCVVVDNPPFSIISEILDFYDKKGVKYFLFTEGKTFASKVKKGRTVILLREAITYENGACIRTAFITNLESEYAIRRCVEMNSALKKINDARKKPKRPHEAGCYSAAQFYALCYNNCKDFKHNELEYIKADKFGALFGGGFKIKEEA